MCVKDHGIIVGKECVVKNNPGTNYDRRKDDSCVAVVSNAPCCHRCHFAMDKLKLSVMSFSLCAV